MHRFWFLFLIAAAAAGQRTDTIFQQIFTNATSAGASLKIRNIGQSQHSLFYVLSDNGGTCSVGNGQVALHWEISEDDTNWARISPYQVRATLSGGVSTGVIVANSPAKNIRARLALNYSNCKLNAYYSGTLQATAYPQLLLSSMVGTDTAATNPSTAGTSVVIVATNTTSRTAIYGMDVHNNGAIANSITLFEHSVSDCTSGVTTGYILRRVNVPATTTAATWPSSLIPYHTLAAGGHLCLTISANSDTAVKVIYRTE